MCLTLSIIVWVDKSIPKSKVDNEPLYDNVPDEDDYATTDELDDMVHFSFRFSFYVFKLMVLFSNISPSFWKCFSINWSKIK